MRYANNCVGVEVTDGGHTGAPPSGREPAFEESAVLRLLAVGVPPAVVIERMSERRKPGFSIDDLRAVLAHAATLAHERRLLPPAQAAFFGRTLLPPAGAVDKEPGVELSVSDLDALRSLAIDLIGKYLAEESDATEMPQPKHVAMQSAALQYAEALLRQQEVIEDLHQAARDESSLHATLTGTDRTRIEELLLNRGGKRLDSRLDGWRQGVERVESDPDFIVFEVYEDRLVARDNLEDALSLLTPPARHVLEQRVGPLDERFLQATRELPTSIRPRSPWQPQRWWWYRAPSRLGEHFKDRLEQLAPEAARAALAAQGDGSQIQGEAQNPPKLRPDDMSPTANARHPNDADMRASR